MTTESRYQSRVLRALGRLSRGVRLVLCGAAAALSLGLVLAGPVAALGAGQPPELNKYLATAQRGVALAGSPKNWGNRKYHWYNELLKDRARSPRPPSGPSSPCGRPWITTLASPSAADLNLVKHFAAKAQTYWNKNITPAPGVHKKSPAYAPYPGSYNDAETFFDDNAWWSWPSWTPTR